MTPLALPLPLDTWDTLPAAGQALILALPAQVVALPAEVAALHAARRELHARLGRDSSNSSRPPSADPPRVPHKRRPAPTGRRRGGQPGHPGRFRSLLPVEPVDEVVVVVPAHGRRCQQPFPGTEVGRHGRPCGTKSWSCCR